MRRLLLGCTLFLLEAVAHALSFSCRQDKLILDVGVTSLFTRLSHQQKDSNEIQVFAGTKRGKIHHFKYSVSDDVMQSLGEVQDDEDLMDSSPFPIFSMTSTTSRSFDNKNNAASGAPFQLFCGGGDRYISIWQEHEQGKKWSCLQRLGPHTGWVKDVLFDHNTGTLHSIGCNCIESWKRNDDLLWNHAATRSIESSLEEGATLSSDLLCLCATDDIDCFFAGGVDGRIHAWSFDATVKDPLYSIRAHDGRINTMVYSSCAELFFSSGHDGSIQCRRAYDGNRLVRTPDAQITIKNADGEPARATALCIVSEKDDHVQLVAGTANGELAYVEATVTNDRVLLSEMSAGELYHHFPDRPMINAICLLKSSKAIGDTWSLAVGHSLGLNLISIER